MRNRIAYILILLSVTIPAETGSAQEQELIQSPICPIVTFNFWDNPLSTQICEVYFCGATSEGEWLEGISADLIGHVEDYTYRVYNFNGFICDAVCHGEDIELYGDRIQAAFMDAPIDVSLIDNTFGIACDWNPLPRLPFIDDPSREDLRNSVSEVLRNLDRDAPGWYVFSEWFDNVYDPRLTEMPFEIREAIRIDLDGDSADEILLNVLVGEDKGYDWEARARMPVLITDSGSYCLDSSDLLGLYHAGVNMCHPEIDLVLDADGDGYMEFTVADGCCLSHEFCYYSYRNGNLNKVSVFDTNKYDVRGMF